MKTVAGIRTGYADNLIGRAETVLFTLHGCRREPGTEGKSGRPIEAMRACDERLPGEAGMLDKARMAGDAGMLDEGRRLGGNR